MAAITKNKIVGLMCVTHLPANSGFLAANAICNSTTSHMHGCATGHNKMVCV